jgi:hypothetical protein
MAAAARAWTVLFRAYLPDVHSQLVDLSLVEPVHGTNQHSPGHSQRRSEPDVSVVLQGEVTTRPCG